MHPRKLLRKWHKTYGVWHAALARHDDEDFTKVPAEGGWTLGQVCDHVAMASQGFMDSAEALAGGAGEPGHRNAMAFVMVDMVGSFPPGRFQVPPNLPPQFEKFAQPETLSKAEAMQRFAAVTERMDALVETIAAAPPKLRSKHPAAGWLKARQWYQLIEMHARHHLRQLRRLGKELAA